MDDIYMIDKALMRDVIETLKTLDVRGWRSMDALVGCVLALEQGFNPPPDTEPEKIVIGKEE